jgi:Chalcone isomerase-like
MTKRIFVLLFTLSAVPALAATLAGVTMPDTITIGDRTLVLNGMGVRSKLFVKVYVGGLYLEQKSGDAGAIIRADAVKRVVLHFIYGEVDRGRMVESFTEGFEGNLPDKGKSLKPQIGQFLGAIETMKKDEELVVTYVPASGTTLAIRGKEKLTIPGQAFGQAVFSIWLGQKPPTDSLKNGMLGRK